MGREFELKYASDPAQQEKILEDLGEFITICMETSYYDTPDGALAARKITLRRRMENGVSVCTVKTPAEGAGRGEWEVNCHSIEAAIEKLCKLGGPEELMTLAQKGVIAVCGARFTRRALAVEIPGEADVYALAGRDGMRSSVMTLNGTDLVAGPKGELPALTGMPVSGQVEVAPGSCAFVIV